MATKQNTTKKGKVKFRFYIFCAIVILIVVNSIKMAIGLIKPKQQPAQPAQATVEEQVLQGETENKQVSPKEIESTKEEPEVAGYTEITVNFKDVDGNALDMNIMPNCFITNITEEKQWKKAVYQNLLNIETNNNESLNKTPTLTSFTGKTVTIKMNTAVEQYFRFIFIPIDKTVGYNPELHKELNIYFTSTPADDGVRVEYDAIVDYYAEMSDDVLKLKLVKKENI